METPHAAVDVVDEDDLLGPEQALGDGKRAHHVVGDRATERYDYSSSLPHSLFRSATRARQFSASSGVGYGPMRSIRLHWSRRSTF
ncbi:MAG: hypothetical protein ACRDYY_04510 [Acidimicrobiales bacterium]